MLDIAYIRENAAEVERVCNLRNVKVDLAKLLETDQLRRAKMGELQQVQAEANALAKQGGKSPENRAEAIEKGKALKARAAELESELTGIVDEFNRLMLTVPNLLPADTPTGADDSANVVVRTFSEPKKFDFAPLDHVQLAQKLDLIDFETAAKVSGAKFYYLKNEAVFLSMALQNFVMHKAVAKGYTPMMAPDLARQDILVGAGYQPRRGSLDGEIYCVENSDLCLIGTAEIPVGGYHADQILDKTQLPLKYVAFSHCFRTEAGAAGRSSKGLYRVHQFDKVECFQFTLPEDADAALEDIVALEEEVFQDLGIPHQVVRICAGDLGGPAYKKYDIEAWMPGKGENGEYGEVTSASNCTDYQARRLNIRYRDDSGKPRFVATLNGTGVAISRALVALLENYQNADGSITIPAALRGWMGGLEKIGPK